MKPNHRETLYEKLDREHATGNSAADIAWRESQAAAASEGLNKRAAWNRAMGLTGYDTGDSQTSQMVSGQRVEPMGRDSAHMLHGVTQDSVNSQPGTSDGLRGIWGLFGGKHVEVGDD
ncbi:hypothetical protein CCP3SC15_1610002 [Gammaproteobacteria bacterium]